MPAVLGEIEGLSRQTVERGIWAFGHDDFLLMAMLMDPVYGAELLWRDPINREYAGCYRVRDYQYPLFRVKANYGQFACARSVGKTESIKARSQSLIFRRQGEDVLLTAPELIHLLPLTDAIEDRIQDTRLTREFLDTRNQKTGFTHRPFGAEFRDGTKLVGRIPKLSGTGVKGQHVPDLMVDEAQDYPEKGWTEVHETVLKDHVDIDGIPDFSYLAYGVHNGARDSGFYTRSQSGGFQVVNITALMRPSWGKEEKEAAKGAYGGTSAPDYRRNILGEAGSAASAFFVTSRLMACIDQDRESDYNQHEYRIQKLQAEEVDKMGVTVEELIDLPLTTGYKAFYMGADLGLVNSPTVLSIWGVGQDEKKRTRMKLLRRIHLERFREKQLRAVFNHCGWQLGVKLEGFGIDMTGLGLPIYQAMEDDEKAPQHLLDVTRGYVFNAMMPIAVNPDFVTKDNTGNLRDQYGNMVKEEVDPITGTKRFIVYMAMIEASTRYLRKEVDDGYMQLPFDPETVADMQGETTQRVQAVAQRKKKPNAFHILDSFRARAMVTQADDIEAALELPKQQPVLDQAMPVAGMEEGLVM